ncbi:class I SAM-dependent methyltransferase [archaeon]|jgi:SAM-dependent methyltransferase|nr:class I SAM-dependent methyltransferase [archaeon]MBT6182473.1 class I SAM-dependent methyltransferase [archaeon]MBT6606100.1 class I SAM-dependent methyltransferase [archaeon]MBT7252060.1 class I SAM-dependent methyltransferase [archaeon]MBT7660991.1 class I SAM-dependent methyltransferase [archaeon]
MNKYDEVRFKVMRELLGNAEDKILLDIGAGVVRLSKGIKTKKTILVDGEAKRNPDIVCDLNHEKFPLENESVDIIIAGELIEHLFNPFKFFKECNRVLSKNGFLILSTPNICSLKNRFKVLFGKLPTNCAEPALYVYEGSYDLQNHVGDFNFPHLKKMLEMTGLKISDARCDGIFIKDKLIIPGSLIPPSLGEKLIVKCVRER